MCGVISQAGERKPFGTTPAWLLNSASDSSSARANSSGPACGRDLVEIAVQADFMAALDEGGQQVRDGSSPPAPGTKIVALDAEAVEKIEEAPDADARAEQALLDLAERGRRASRGRLHR